ncbi:uncharacterized protein LOC129765028 [Toxorhynchites rutilus septentrionalis]|nr:uncharacterized protein LOC129765028 [Toxorhynchites rutilus septentrionalis]
MVVLRTMFHDSQIAEKVQLGRDKMSYMMLFGIAPYYKSELDKTLHNTNCIVVGFDESLNKTTKKQQMDLNVRFWDEEKKEVVTRYMTSMFLGRSRATDLHAAFKEGLGNIPLNKLLQVSMDGPNVNWSFLRELKMDFEHGEERLLDLGSCGLHILHGAFKEGVRCSGWNVTKYLRGIYHIFKDVPARRALFTSYSGSAVYPLKFCAHRWLENINVAQRAVEITPHIRKFVEGVQNDKIEPKSDSYVDVVECLKDPLLLAKLTFFKSVAAEVEPFLREFQTDNPMVPFLYNNLSQMARSILGRFMQIDQLKNITQVTIEEINEAKNHLPMKEIVLGFETRKVLKNSSKLTQKQILQFRLECKGFLKALILKLMKRSPLTYPVTKAASSLDPSVIDSDQKLAGKRFEKLLTILMDFGRISGASADLALKQYLKLVGSNKSNKFAYYDRKNERLDHFWKGLLSGDEFMELFTIVKMICCLSHGNANLERGFSINAECLFENMREESVVAKRQIYDAVFHAGEIASIQISNQLIQRVRNSHSLYIEDKERRKKEDLASNASKMMKRQREAEAKSLEIKRSKILENAQKEAESLQEKIALLKSTVL